LNRATGKKFNPIIFKLNVKMESIRLSLVFILGFVLAQSISVKPEVVTSRTSYDADDPAIWVNKEDPSKSIIFGTDKNSDGAVYAFDLEGKVIKNKVIRNLARPNNVDIEYGLKLNDLKKVDILVVTERERNQLRVFSIPDMKPLDDGGLPVFIRETNPKLRLPMGIALYRSPRDESIHAIVSRKNGPREKYLDQYKLVVKNNKVSLELLRSFGSFSGKKEIEAIAVDDELGFIYYSDEQHCVRKYYAEPSMGNKELACFGGDKFKKDIEGIAIAVYPEGEGYLIVSNQDKGTFNIFSRGSNDFIKEIDLGTKETDGCEVVTTKLPPPFESGLFVAMNNDRNFYYYALNSIVP
jgi:3-phytase